MEHLFTPSLTAFYTVAHPSGVQVRFSSDAPFGNDPGLLVSILHESQLCRHIYDEGSFYVDSYEFLGGESSPIIEVEDKDVLIVLVKRHDHIVASQIFEVALSAVAVGYLLIPRGGYNLLVEQSEQLRESDIEDMHKPERLQEVG